MTKAALLLVGCLLIFYLPGQVESQCNYFDPSTGCFYDLSIYQNDFLFSERNGTRNYDYAVNICDVTTTNLGCTSQFDASPSISIRQKTVATNDGSCYNLGSNPGIYSPYSGSLAQAGSKCSMSSHSIESLLTLRKSQIPARVFG